MPQIVGQKIVRQPDYNDIDLDFFANPATKDIITLTGADAIKRSIRNLIFTNFYERPFRSSIGSNVRKLLFDLATPLTATFLRTAMIETITNLEPRAQLLDVEILPAEDQNSYSATIYFKVKNLPQPLVITIFLNRIR